MTLLNPTHPDLVHAVECVRQELESRPRPLRIEEPARKMRAQLAALRGVGQ